MKDAHIESVGSFEGIVDHEVSVVQGKQGGYKTGKARGEGEVAIIEGNEKNISHNSFIRR